MQDCKRIGPINVENSKSAKIDNLVGAIQDKLEQKLLTKLLEQIKAVKTYQQRQPLKKNSEQKSAVTL